MSIPTDAGAGLPPTPASRPEFSAVIPEGFSEEVWVKDFAKAADPFKALFDGYKGVQAQLGKRAEGVQIPGEGAAPEAVKAFHKAIGVPDSPDGYEYKAPDISQLPDNVKAVLAEEAKDDSFIKAMRVKAHELGITPQQFAELAATVDALKIEQVKSMVEASAAQGQQQLENFNKIYGDKAEYVKRVAAETAAKVLPENVRDLKDPEIALYEAMKYIHEKWFKTSPISGADMTGSPALSREDLQKRIFELRAQPAFRDAWNPQHETLFKRVTELTKQLIEHNS